jgi:hypothetical protein
MSDYFTTALLVTGIVAVAVLAAVFFLIIPLRISLSLRSNGVAMQGILSASWFISGLDITVSDNDTRVSLTIGGIGFMTRTVSAHSNRQFMPPGVPGAGRIAGVISRLPSLSGLVFNAILDLIRHTRLDYIRGNARIGLGDPAATGMVFGLYHAFRALVPSDRIDFNLTPEFGDEVCEIDLKTRFHIAVPVRIIVSAAKIAKHPASRSAMNAFRKRPAGAAE